MTDSSPHIPGRFDGETERFACFAARLMADSRCENVTLLNVRGISQVTDYLVIASGTSERMLRSVASDLKELARRESQSVFRSDDGQSSEWVVIDLVDVVVHLLTPPQRAYYDLESLWGDAGRVDWQSRTTPGQFAKIGRKAAG